jgi:hypothetical protein
MYQRDILKDIVRGKSIEELVYEDLLDVLHAYGMNYETKVWIVTQLLVQITKDKQAINDANHANDMMQQNESYIRNHVEG